MTTAEDYAILQEYQDWTESLATGVPDTSIEAFKRHREAEFNAGRIRKALDGFSLDRMEVAYDAIEEPTAFERQAFAALTQVRDALEGDLEFTEERTFGGVARRVHS